SRRHCSIHPVTRAACDLSSAPKIAELDPGRLHISSLTSTRKTSPESEFDGHASRPGAPRAGGRRRPNAASCREKPPGQRLTEGQADGTCTLVGAREPISLLVPFSTNFSGIPPQFGRFRNSACAWGNDMLWLFITAAGIGALLGLAVLRVLAVFAASV